MDQKTKTVHFWKTNISNITRERVLSQARNSIADEITEIKERQAMTNKHDRARILHLRVDPGAAADWTAALREKTRSQLDTDDPDADPWNRLAAKFNDYDTFNYTNAVVQPNVLTSKGLPVAVPDMQALLEYCLDINPCVRDRPLRDAGWLRTQFRDLKGKISVCFNNYRRSGNQEAENIYDEWVKFSSHNDVIVYSRAILDDSDMDQLGRALPTAVQRDTGALEPEDTYENKRAAALERKRKRLEEAERQKPVRRDSVSPTTSPLLVSSNSTGTGTILTQTIQAGIARANKISEQATARSNEILALRALMEFGNEEEKRGAIEKLKNLYTTH